MTTNNEPNTTVLLPESDEKNEKTDQRGASLVEYALLVALIAIVCIAAVTALGRSVSKQFSGINSSLTAG